MKRLGKTVIVPYTKGYYDHFIGFAGHEESFTYVNPSNNWEKRLKDLLSLERAGEPVYTEVWIGYTSRKERVKYGETVDKKIILWIEKNFPEVEIWTTEDSFFPGDWDDIERRIMGQMEYDPGGTTHHTGGYPVQLKYYRRLLNSKKIDNEKSLSHGGYVEIEEINEECELAKLINTGLLALYDAKIGLEENRPWLKYCISKNVNKLLEKFVEIGCLISQEDVLLWQKWVIALKSFTGIPAETCKRLRENGMGSKISATIGDQVEHLYNAYRIAYKSGYVSIELKEATIDLRSFVKINNLWKFGLTVVHPLWKQIIEPEK